MHFFSPVPVMPLVELIRGEATADETVETIRGLSAELGKQVIVSDDRPGFIVNRILMPFLAEAMRAYEQGVGTAEDIDAGARVGLNHPMGPLELADFIGLDVCLGIMRVLEDGLGLEHMRPPRVLVELVEAGHLGPEDGARLLHLPADLTASPPSPRGSSGRACRGRTACASSGHGVRGRECLEPRVAQVAAHHHDAAGELRPDRRRPPRRPACRTCPAIW